MKTRLSTGVVLLLLASAFHSESQVIWERQSDRPVLPSSSGSIHDPSAYRYAFMPSVMYDSSDGMYKMWFASLTPYNGAQFNISYAISVDGTDWFVRARNPVLSPGSSESFDSEGVWDPYVIRDGREYKMYYTGFDGTLYRTGLATSPDGVKWTKSTNNPILDVGPRQWETVGSNAPKVYKVDSVYCMLYSGFDGTRYEIGLATSPDGRTWTKQRGDPVITNGEPGSWDSHSVITNTVAHVGGVYYCFFLGQPSPTQESVGLAISIDGMTWEKHPGNPVFTANPGHWDGRILYGSVVFKDNLFHYWYSGYSSSWQIGYAISPLGPTGAVESREQIGSNFRLLQSYPNPFNPSTTIEFFLPKTQRVTLTVFNNLGQEVARLLDGREESGYHSVNFKTSSMSSGIYYYQLKADGFSATKKMTLLK